MGETQKTSGRPLVYLASGSAQRKAILGELGISYQSLRVDVEEIAAATPRQTVEENAGRKLLAGVGATHASPVRVNDHSPALVIAADTVLEVQGRVLGKPADEAMATRYLEMLSGNTATAHSAVAVAVVSEAEGCLATETAEVHFKVLPPEVIRWYVSTGEPMGRAGAFGIGRLGEVLTESVDGCYSCVSGLPKTALLLALTQVAGAKNLWPLPEPLRHVPTVLKGTKVQLRSLAVDADPPELT